MSTYPVSLNVNAYGILGGSVLSGPLFGSEMDTVATRSADAYATLVTSEHRRTKFLAMLGIYSQWAVDRLSLVSSLPAAFSIDSAVGVQLDAVGMWVNVGRTVTVLPSEAFPGDAPYQVLLDDGTYRRVIKACVQANKWDGTPAMLQTILQVFYAPRGITAAVHDNQDMSIDLYLAGGYPTDAEAAVLAQMIIPVRPTGVRVNKRAINPAGPILGLDIENAVIAGPDVGGFGEVF